MPGNTQDYAVFMEKGFNSLYSHVENVRFIPRPSEDGVFGDSFCVAKRHGLVFGGADAWQTDGNIVGADYAQGKIYPFTDNSKLYSLSKDGLVEITSTGTTYDSDYSSDALSFSYVGGGRYPDAVTEFTVVSGTTNNIVVSGGTLTDDYIGRYFYVASGAATGLRQVRAIFSQSGGNTFVFTTPLIAPVTAGDKIRVFNKLENQIIYPALRQTSDTEKCLSVDKDGNKIYMYHPNIKKMVLYDGRFIQLNTEGSAILVSQPGEYEILDATKLVTLSNTCINIETWGAYVVLFFENEIGILKKEIVDVTSGAYIYRYQSISNVGLFSEKSYLISGSDFYVYGSDNVPSTVSVTISSTGDVLATLKPFATLYSSYFQRIASGEVYMIKTGEDLRIIHVDELETTVYINHNNVEGRSIDRFSGYNGNFMKFYNNIGASYYTCFEDRVLMVGGLTDEDTNIRQYIKSYGPPQLPGVQFLSNQCKFILGNNGRAIGGIAKVTLGVEELASKEANFKKSQIVSKINTVAVGEASLGSSIVGSGTVGGDELTSDELYMEYIDVALKYRLSGGHYIVEITNETEDDLVYAGHVFQTINQMTEVFPTKNIL